MSTRVSQTGQGFKAHDRQFSVNAQRLGQRPAPSFVHGRDVPKAGKENTQHETRQLNPWRTRTRQDATPAFCGKQTHLCNKAVESVFGSCGFKTTPDLVHPTRTVRVRWIRGRGLRWGAPDRLVVAVVAVSTYCSCRSARVGLIPAFVAHGRDPARSAFRKPSVPVLRRAGAGTP
jgi:hypothetical protein